MSSPEPEWIPAGERRPFNDRLAEQIAWLMDSAIQVGPISIGFDGLLGLIPGLGDMAGSIIGALIVLRAMQSGVHRAAILRMVMNLGIDTLVGSVPVVGDLFDFAFKANTKNLQIYRESLDGTRKPVRDWAFIALVVAALVSMIVLPILGLVFLLQWITS